MPVVAFSFSQDLTSLCVGSLTIPKNSQCWKMVFVVCGRFSFVGRFYHLSVAWLVNRTFLQAESSFHVRSVLLMLMVAMDTE